MRSTEPTRSGARSPTLRGKASDSTLHIGAMGAIPEVLRTLGADPADVCAAAGIDAALFDDPSNLISYRAASRLFRVCAERTRRPHFGLLVGQKSGLHSLGLLGLLMKYSPDVESALRSLVRYMHLHIGGAVTTLQVSGKTAMLDYEIYQADAEATDQIGDGAVATMYNIMRELCGPKWNPLEVRLAHRKPDDVAPYRKFFQTPLRFDAEENALVFFADSLRRPLPVADRELRRLLATQIEALEALHGENLPDQVRSVLRTALLTGHAKADQVAAFFSVHSRTLSRRLHAFGSSFQELVDEIRFEIAGQMLRDSTKEVGEIAELLDYASASAFTRAFRRWSGTTPAAWRAKSRRDKRGKG